MLRATWYKGTAQLLCLTEFKWHLFQLYFIGWTIKWWGRGGNRSTWRKPLVTSFKKCHILQPKIQAPRETWTLTIALAAGQESRRANRFTTVWSSIQSAAFEADSLTTWPQSDSGALPAKIEHFRDDVCVCICVCWFSSVCQFLYWHSAAESHKYMILHV